MARSSVIRLPTTGPLATLKDSSFCDLTAPSDDHQRTLRDLLKSHHTATIPLREPKLLLHDHMPHILCSAVVIGHDSPFLKEAYDTVMKTLVEIDSSFLRGDKIEKDRLREYFGRREYTLAFVDFFDQEFERDHGDWKKTVEKYLFETDKPFMNGLIGGLGHSIIHLAYAYDFGCSEVASEGLSLLCTDYSDFHVLFDHPQPDTATYKTSSLAEVLERIQEDSRFDGLVQNPGLINLEKVMKERGDAVIEHWNAWEVTIPLEQLEHICDLGTMIAISTYDVNKEFDFFLIHLMTVAQALRSLWNHFPLDRRAPMLKQYAMMFISMYICQQRLPVRMERIEAVAINGRDWNSVWRTAREHPAKFDVHFFKVVRAPKAFEDTYGSKDGFYLKAALKFLDEFRGWTGFGVGVPGFDEKSAGWSAPKETQDLSL